MTFISNNLQGGTRAEISADLAALADPPRDQVARSKDVAARLLSSSSRVERVEVHAWCREAAREAEATARGWAPFAELAALIDIFQRDGAGAYASTDHARAVELLRGLEAWASEQGRLAAVVAVAEFRLQEVMDRGRRTPPARWTQTFREEHATAIGAMDDARRDVVGRVQRIRDAFTECLRMRPSQKVIQ